MMIAILCGDRLGHTLGSQHGEYVVQPIATSLNRQPSMQVTDWSSATAICPFHRSDGSTSDARRRSPRATCERATEVMIGKTRMGWGSCDETGA